MTPSPPVPQGCMDTKNLGSLVINQKMKKDSSKRLDRWSYRLCFSNNEINLKQ